MLEHLRLSRRLTVSVRSYLATRPSRCVLGRGQGLGASTRPTSVFCCLATRWYSELRTQRIYAALLVEADCLLLPVTGQCTGLQLDTATSLAARVMHQTMRSSRASGCRGLCASGNTRDTLPAITALRTERSLEHLAMTERSCRLTSTSVPRPIVSSWHDQQCTSYRGPAAVEAVAPHSQASTPPPDSSADRPRARLVVFVSGGGSNFKALHAACLDGSIHADVVAVVSDIPSCGGIAYAASLGIPTLTFPIPKSKAFEGLTVAQLVEALQVTHKADYVLLAGFLKLIPLALVQAFPRAMLNIHPALLPAFGGKVCHLTWMGISILECQRRNCISVPCPYQAMKSTSWTGNQYFQGMETVRVNLNCGGHFYRLYSFTYVYESC